MSILSNWNGGDTRDDIRSGRRIANNRLNQGRRNAQGMLNKGWQQGRQYLNPYIQGGQSGQSMYDNLLGINGAGQRDEAQGLLMSDAAFTGKLGQDQNAMLRAMNARGMSGSGAGALAAERVFQQNYGDVLNRYANRGAQGQQAAQYGAGLANNWGNQSANLTYGNAQQLAGNILSSQNAIGQTRNTGMNNLMNIAGLGLKAAALF